MTTTTMKIYDIQPTLDNPSLSRIRFPAWLKCLYDISQMELTTLDPLGAFYLVALDEDWDIRPENLNQQNQVDPRPLFCSTTHVRCQCRWCCHCILQHQGCSIRIPTTRSCRSSLGHLSKSRIRDALIHQFETSIWHQIPLPSRPRT
jgi:hypothetical protein